MLCMTAAPVSEAAVREQAVFGGGCFWAFQAEFEMLRGVDSAVPGYAGGNKANPTYDEVCAGDTGHAEVIQVTFDPKVISYQTLLRAFFGAHDPTSLDRQGPDSGSQYHSIILPANQAQVLTARKLVTELTAAKAHPKPIVTEIKRLQRFYPADEHHLHYYAKHPDEPYTRHVVAKEVAHFRKLFGPLLVR
ncbi:MAG: peptide-methionine (S)-S-oxide reductase MsrA [Candidatus Sericytochromatia bacterium]|nr:peptide-methionine (S)-S-oxide reductase MsrA [Candidatus Sericytochromatia bacterium]